MKAPRDMTSKQFREALTRNGFAHACLFWFNDTTGTTPNISYSGIFYRNGKIARRATIAHLKRKRDHEQGRNP